MKEKMEIKLKEVTIRELVKGYIDNQDEGVTGYNGKLDIRPEYQREFIYKDEQRNAVIDTVKKDFPLNTMYWIKNGDNFEVLDGQQRTISICEYVTGKFSVGHRAFHNLTRDEQEQILNYKLMVYICEGKESEKLDWFKTINIGGEKLTNQELLNAIYSGQWLSDAKRYFSKPNCQAYNIGKGYLKGYAIRQTYLETAIKWISSNNVEEYMSKMHKEPNANELWLYFQKVINWVKTVFPKYMREMKGVPFGLLFNEYGDKAFDSKELEKEISKLMQDEDVTSKSGIYQYIITRNEKYLNIRNFSNNQKRETYERQEGLCKKCGKHFVFDETEADHITPWHKGGKTEVKNCQVLCVGCNRKKSGK